MRIAVDELDRLTGRHWGMLVGRDCASAAAGIELIAERLVESAGLRAGDAVLDVATGTGNAALAAARCGSVVTGVDDVVVLLERGRERAAAEGLSVTFGAGDAERLPYPDGSFDAVLSCLGVMFTCHHRQAASELVRVCRPGGTIALANWTPASFVGRMFQTVAAHVPAPSLMWPPGLWGTEQHVRHLLGHAVTDVAFTRREFIFRVCSSAEFVDVFRNSRGPIRKAFEALDQSGRQALYEDLTALIARYDREPGTSVAVASEYLEAIAVVRLTGWST